jgi:hypothetical protein
VRPDATRDPVACDGESTRDRQCRVHCANDGVFYDHGRRLYPARKEIP